MTNDPEKQVSSSHNGEMPKAVDPDLQLQDALANAQWEQVESLLLSHGERLLLDGSRGLVLQALKALPEAQSQAKERLLCLQAWAHVFGQRYREAWHYLGTAERKLARLTLAEGIKVSPDLQASLNALRMHLSALEEGGALPDDVSQLMLPASTEHPIWHASALLTLARCRILSGAFELAQGELETARLLAGTASSRRARRVEAKALLTLAYIARLKGNLSGVEAYLHEAAPLVASANDPAVEASARVRWAYLAFLKGNESALTQELSVLETLVATQDVEFDPIGVHLELGLLKAEVASQRHQDILAQRELSLLEEALSAWEVKWPLDLLAAERLRLSVQHIDTTRAKRQWQQILVRERKPSLPRNLLEAARMRAHAAVAQVAQAHEDVRVRATLLEHYAAATQQAPLRLDALVMLARVDNSRERLVEALTFTQDTGLWGLLPKAELKQLAETLELSHPLLEQLGEVPLKAQTELEDAAPLDEVLLN